MFTQQALIKAKIDLYNIVANFSMQDYTKANYNKYGKRKRKKHIPYSLSMETLEAKEMYNIVFFGDVDTITTEEEEKVKAYLLTFRLHRQSYLQDAGGLNYHGITIKTV